MKTKACRKCGLELPLSEYNHRGGGRSGLMSRCKKCHCEASKKWQRANPKRRMVIARRCRYGIEPEEYAAFLMKQNGVCAVCGRPETRILRGKVNTLSVDHDHKTNKVRGLLCHHCNVALGHAEESISRLRQLIAYLKRNK